MTAKVLYTDLDGTMVGPHGCFFRAGDRSLTLEPARALLELHAAGVAVVLVSGRTRPQLVEAAAIFGADGYVGEMGAVLGWDRARQGEVLRGAMPEAFPGTPVEVMHAAGLPEALFDRYAGRLAWHDPWHRGHEADLMLRGSVDPAEVEGWLRRNGWEWLRLHDNGILAARAMPDGGPVHVYHLMPAGIDKGLGVARDLERRGLAAADAVAVGDSLSDLAMAAHVGQFFLVANGAAAPATSAAARALPNVRITRDPVGLGWAEAARAALASP